jgi:hypothetical protein
MVKIGIKLYNFDQVDMKFKLKKALFTVGLVLITPIFVIGLILLLPTTGWEYSSKEFSPNGMYYAQVTESNGGATTAYSSGVSIVYAKSQLNNLGIVSGWMGTRASVFGLNGRLSSIKTTWLDNRTLKITYTSCRQIYGQDNTWKEIKIVYEEKCSSNN